MTDNFDNEEKLLTQMVNRQQLVRDFKLINEYIEDGHTRILWLPKGSEEKYGLENGMCWYGHIVEIDQ